MPCAGASAEWEDAERSCRRAHEIAEQVGRSEVAFSALHWLAATLRDQGRYGDAETALAQALDVCERAGLVAQSVEATAERAVCLALGGRTEQAREVAESATNLIERLHYPVGLAAAQEAQGLTSEDAAVGVEQLAGARDAWAKLELPIDAARAEMLRAHRLAEIDIDDARIAAEEAAQRFEALGIDHEAQRAREMVSG